MPHFRGTERLVSAHHWYAIRVHANCERRVSSSLSGKGLEAIFPVCWQQRRWANRLRKVERAMFPGYVFGRFNPENRLPVLVTPGVAYIVGTRTGPQPVDPNEMASVLALAASAANAEPWPFLSVGQLVTLEAGPLRGVCGRVLAVNSNWKVVVSVTLLQRSVAVEIDANWLTPEDAPVRALARGV